MKKEKKYPCAINVDEETHKLVKIENAKRVARGEESTMAKVAKETLNKALKK